MMLTFTRNNGFKVSSEKLVLQFNISHPVLVKWQSSDLTVLETPFIQILGHDRNGNRVVWINIKYNSAVLMESAKRAIAYHFESGGFSLKFYRVNSCCCKQTTVQN